MTMTAPSKMRRRSFKHLKTIYQLKVCEVALGVVFHAGDVVVYPVWCAELGDLGLVHADGVD